MGEEEAEVSGFFESNRYLSIASYVLCSKALQVTGLVVPD